MLLTQKKLIYNYHFFAESDIQKHDIRKTTSVMGTLHTESERSSSQLYDTTHAESFTCATGLDGPSTPILQTWTLWLELAWSSRLTGRGLAPTLAAPEPARWAPKQAARTPPSAPQTFRRCGPHPPPSTDSDNSDNIALQSRTLLMDWKHIFFIMRSSTEITSLYAEML